MLYSSRRNKANGFEYDCEYNLKRTYPDIRATEKRGFAAGYDLISEQGKIVVECKFHRTITWNELVKWYILLEKRMPLYSHAIVYKTNLQPVLVFRKDNIFRFESLFGKFERRPKKNGKDKEIALEQEMQ